MTARERNEHDKLTKLWATGRATKKQIERCMELDRKESATRHLVTTVNQQISALRNGGGTGHVAAALEEAVEPVRKILSGDSNGHH
jgi:hypothetical protein